MIMFSFVSCLSELSRSKRRAWNRVRIDSNSFLLRFFTARCVFFLCDRLDFESHFQILKVCPQSQIERKENFVWSQLNQHLICECFNRDQMKAEWRWEIRRVSLFDGERGIDDWHRFHVRVEPDWSTRTARDLQQDSSRNISIPMRKRSFFSRQRDK